MDARIRIALTVYAFFVLGLFLVVAPWTGLWNRAMLVALPTGFGPWLLTGWARGLVSGLGALNLAAAGHAAGDLVRALRHGTGAD